MNKERPSILRFSFAQRVEHLLLVISFGALILTGIPQMSLFKDTGIAPAIINLLGGIEIVRIIHRVSATMLMFETIFHLVVLGYKLFVLRVSASMLPGPKDAGDALQAFTYNLGLKRQKPRMGRYNFTEKAEYWAMIWGLFVMGLTGFMLWNPIATTKILPGVFIPAAKVAHGGEALLAALAIVVWHFYGVHLKEWNWGMLNGRLTRRQMEEEHGLELAEMEASPLAPEIPAEILHRRKKVYFPLAAVVSLVLLGLVYGFVSGEKTAITTLPPSEGPQVVVFVPQTPTPVPLPPQPSPTARQMKPKNAESAPAGGVEGAVTWDGGVAALFAGRCGACHGTLGGLDLLTYAGALKGGSSGAVIIPGDADASSLLAMQASGSSHPGLFNAEELQAVKTWIVAGAPEK